jgi:hypothetical protein
VLTTYQKDIPAVWINCSAGGVVSGIFALAGRGKLSVLADAVKVLFRLREVIGALNQPVYSIRSL